jgi:predicted SprT family Zn-dependent metalloprotease
MKDHKTNCPENPEDYETVKLSAELILSMPHKSAVRMIDEIVRSMYKAQKERDEILQTYKMLKTLSKILYTSEDPEPVDVKKNYDGTTAYVCPICEFSVDLPEQFEQRVKRGEKTYCSHCGQRLTIGEEKCSTSET